jgi:hypothetical protein
MYEGRVSCVVIARRCASMARSNASPILRSKGSLDRHDCSDCENTDRDRSRAYEARAVLVHRSRSSSTAGVAAHRARGPRAPDRASPSRTHTLRPPRVAANVCARACFRKVASRCARKPSTRDHRRHHELDPHERRKTSGALPNGSSASCAGWRRVKAPTRLAYHAAPRACRASIESYGLDSHRDSIAGLPGTYLWERPEQAVAYAAPLRDDVWVVDCTGIPLEFGGPFSIVAGERWTADPIAAERLRGRIETRRFGGPPADASVAVAERT